jgi:hypothetical protein
VAGAAPPCLFKNKCNNGWKCIFTVKLWCYGIFLPAQGQECRGFDSPLPLLYYFKLQEHGIFLPAQGQECRGFDSPLPLLYYFKLQERYFTLRILFDQFLNFFFFLVVVHICILGIFCPDWFFVYFSLTFMLVHV